jgi:VWFA-related protein
MRVRTRPYTPQAPAVRVQTDLVLARVVVRDRQGRPVSGLDRSDFEILDNGKPQAITAFSVEGAPPAEATPAATPAPQGGTPLPPPPEKGAARPRYILLFFDDANLRLGDLAPARQAALDFVSTRLRPGDRIGLFTSSSVEPLNFTADRDAIQRKLAALRPQLRRPDDGAGACPRIGPYQAHLIVNQKDRESLDVAIAQMQTCPEFARMAPRELAAIATRQADVVLSLAEQFSQSTVGRMAGALHHLARMPGQRVMLLASSGFWTMTLQREQHRLIDSALRAEITIHTLDAKGLGGDGPDPGDGPPIVLGRRPDLQVAADRLLRQQREVFNDPLVLLAQGTGGRFFHNSNDLGRGAAELLAAPDTIYLLGFSPENLKPDGSFHRLKVRLTRAAAHGVESRPGYFAPSKEEQDTEGVAARVDAVVAAGEVVSEIPMEVRAAPGTTSEGRPALKVEVRVDIQGLPFQRRNGRSVERLRLVTALFGREGRFLSGSQALVELSLRDATRVQLAKEGLVQSVTLEGPRGDYILRQVVQEEAQGRIASLSREVQIQ